MISAVQLGRISYAEGLRLQQRLVELRKAGQIGDVLLLLEHTPVITLGRNAKAANVLASPEQLAARGVEVFGCDRGGDVTFHGPGQLVGYPIFDLRGFSRQPSAPSPFGSGQAKNSHQEHSSQFSVLSSQKSGSQLSGLSTQENQKSGQASSPGHRTLGAVDYVRRLEEVLIRTCADFGIAAKRVAGLTGVWTEGREAKNQNDGNDPSSLAFARDFGARLERRASASTSTRAASLRSGALARDDREGNGSRGPLDWLGAGSSTPQDDRFADRPAPLRMTTGGGARVSPRGWRASFDEAKIAAIGVHISRSVTSHGFALNVNTDLSFFDLIVPCGIQAKPVTSMQKELGLEVDLVALAQSVARNFGVVFGRQILWVKTLDALLGNTVGVPVKPPAELRKLHGDEESFLA